jgi:hypothetical protein
VKIKRKKSSSHPHYVISHNASMPYLGASINYALAEVENRRKFIGSIIACNGCVNAFSCCWSIVIVYA